MAANAVGKRCSEVERAYIAGFLDADGAIMAIIERHKEKRFGFRIRVMIKITQRDRSILDWMQKKLGVGRVRANRLGDSRQTFDLHVLDQQHARGLLKMLMPYVRAKKKQARMALAILEATIASKRDVIRIAQLADALSRFNVRSKDRRKNHAIKVQEHFSSND